VSVWLGLPFLCPTSWLQRGKGPAEMGIQWHGGSVEPGGSAGVEPTMASQQLQGTMLPELRQAWPIDAWREAGKATAGSK